MTRTAGWHTPDYDPRVDGEAEDYGRWDRPTRAEAERDEYETRSRHPRKMSPEEQADFDKRWGFDKPLTGTPAYVPPNDDPWNERKTSATRGPRGPFEDEKHYWDDRHREDMVRDLNAADDDEARAMAEEDGHLRTEKRQGLVGEGSLNDGSFTDGKIVGQCPGCTKPIRKHKTAHGDELRHLHNNHVRCFGEAKTAGGADLPAAAGEAAAEDVPGVGTALKAADIGGKALNGIEHELEKTPDMWAYRAESALQMYADYLGRPDANNPTGRGPDEYKANTWDAFQRTRPMQSGEDRGINTPVLPAEPIKTRNINTPTRGLEGREDDLRHSDDDDDED